MTNDTAAQLRDFLTGFARHDPAPLRAIATLSAQEPDPNTWWREEAREAIRSRLRSLMAGFPPDLLVDLSTSRLDAATVVVEVLGAATTDGE